MNRYRALSALVFHRLCQLTGLSATELCSQLEARLERQHKVSRVTLRAWRRGDNAVPVEALAVVADLARWRFRSIEQLLLGEMIEDPAAREEAYAALLNRVGALDGVETEGDEPSPSPPQLQA